MNEVRGEGRGEVRVRRGRVRGVLEVGGGLEDGRLIEFISSLTV